ncbi:MAG: T9SS type A sorting domain-containing protein [Bacteroidota bacterium]
MKSNILLVLSLFTACLAFAQPAEFTLPCAGTTDAQLLVSYGQINGVAVEPGQDWLGAFDSDGFCIGNAQAEIVPASPTCPAAAGFRMNVYGSAGNFGFCPMDFGADVGEVIEVLLFDGSSALFYVYPGTWQFQGAFSGPFPPQDLAQPCAPDNATVLPVELVSLRAAATSRQTGWLTWITATETENSHFEIERSTDGQRWRQIGRVEGYGNSDVARNYQFEDVRPGSGINYYRLKQVDYDGAFEYSHVVFADMKSGDDRDLSIFPNPIVTETITLGFSGNWGVSEATDVRIYDLHGRVVAEWQDLASISQTITLPTLAAGVYTLVAEGGGEQIAERVVVR